MKAISFTILLSISIAFFAIQGCTLNTGQQQSSAIQNVFDTAVPLQIRASEFDKKYRKPAGYQFGTMLDFPFYDYIDSGSWIGIRVPTDKEHTKFIYASKSAESRLLNMYVVRFFPELTNNHLFNGRIEWLDFQTCTFYGVHYTQNVQDAWLDPVKVPFENDSLKLPKFKVEQDTNGEIRRQFPASRLKILESLERWRCSFNKDCWLYDPPNHMFLCTFCEGENQSNIDLTEIPRKYGRGYGKIFKARYGSGFRDGGYGPGLGTGARDGFNPWNDNRDENRFPEAKNLWTIERQFRLSSFGRSYIISDVPAGTYYYLGDDELYIPPTQHQ